MGSIKRISAIVWLSLCTLMMTSFTASAEQMTKMGNWDVHYIAFGSTFLTPKIAKAYGITRSKYNGVINISVLNSSKDNKAEQVSIRGKGRNLVGNEVDLKFKEVIEGESVYYLAQISYSNEETFRFEIKIRQGNREETLKFNQVFYAE